MTVRELLTVLNELPACCLDWVVAAGYVGSENPVHAVIIDPIGAVSPGVAAVTLSM